MSLLDVNFACMVWLSTLVDAEAIELLFWHLCWLLDLA